MQTHAARLGHFYVQTFGCQMNVHDSDRISEMLVTQGWKPTSSQQQADLVVFNTCSVREKAEQKLRSEVGKWADLKKEKPTLIVAAVGCVAQQEGNRLLRQIPLLDLVVGPDNLHELPQLLQEQIGGSPPIARTEFDLESPRFLQSLPTNNKAPVSAWVTTMKGCDERCSFCIVPYTRGPERYRPVQDILREIQRLVSEGTREVTLLGQTVDSYRDPALPPPENDDPDESQFPALLRLIAGEVPGLARLRYTSPHPRHTTPALVRAHADLDVLAHHVHLPVQSGSDRILKRMIRRYNRAEYIQRANQLRAARPDMTLSTDIIVGFPGETEDDFQQTLSLVEEVGFVSLYGFAYSVRPYAPARKLEDDVPAEVKSERLQRLLHLSDQLGIQHLANLADTTATVLVEQSSKHGELRARHGHVSLGVHYEQGRTERNELVHIALPVGWSLVGKLVPVRITETHKRSLSAEPTPEGRNQLYPAITSASQAPRLSLPVVGGTSPNTQESACPL